MKWLQFLPSRWWSPKAWRDWMKYVRWRLETYGVYYPAGKFNRAAFCSLLKQLPSYNRWLSEISVLRKKQRREPDGPINPSIL